MTAPSACTCRIIFGLCAVAFAAFTYERWRAAEPANLGDGWKSVDHLESSEMMFSRTGVLGRREVKTTEKRVVNSTRSASVFIASDEQSGLPLPLGSFDERLFPRGAYRTSRIRPECLTIVQVHDDINTSLFRGMNASDIVDLALKKPSLVAVSEFTRANMDRIVL